MKSLSVNKKILIIFIAGIALSISAALFVYSRFNVIPQIIDSATRSEKKLPFPNIDTTQLSDDQNKVVAILKAEYELNPKGTKYSQGVEEAWCADFVSWVYNEADKPLLNPHSGSWRIPGTFTLREYYESIGKLKLADSGYTPKVGDIMLYDNPSPFGQHTNIVIENDNGVVTTIGGNEPGGIRIVKHEKPDTVGFIGYGVF